MRLLSALVLIGFLLSFAGGIAVGSVLHPAFHLVVSPGAQTIFVNAIKEAKEEVLVSVYLLTDEDIVRALEEARAHGVRVVVLVDGDLGANKEAVETLRRAGCIVKCVSKPFKHFHAKYMVIDNHKVFVGSHNFTHSAMLFNREVSLVVDSPALAAELKSIFSQDFQLSYLCFAG